MYGDYAKLGALTVAVGLKLLHGLFLIFFSFPDGRVLAKLSWEFARIIPLLRCDLFDRTVDDWFKD